MDYLREEEGEEKIVLTIVKKQDGSGKYHWVARPSLMGHQRETSLGPTLS